MLRTSVISAIAVCVWLSAVGWYATFTPGEPQVFFLVWPPVRTSCRDPDISLEDHET